MTPFIENNLAAAWLLILVISTLALLVACFLFYTLLKYRRDQKTIIGGSRQRDIVAHTKDLKQNLDGIAYDLQNLSDRVNNLEQRLDKCLTHRSMVRYDAYRDLSGMQSTSVALLDTQFSGMIISAIQSRDHARIYVKNVSHGESREKLSPEEIQVLKEAMGLKSDSMERERLRGGLSA